jgi:hypothetical protein
MEDHQTTVSNYQLRLRCILVAYSSFFVCLFFVTRLKCRADRFNGTISIVGLLHFLARMGGKSSSFQSYFLRTEEASMFLFLRRRTTDYVAECLWAIRICSLSIADLKNPADVEVLLF